MTVSGSGQRLILAAEKAIDGHHRAHLGEAKDVTAALLREVADELFESLLDRVEPGMVVRPNVIPELLRGWADSIEKGE